MYTTVGYIDVPDDCDDSNPNIYPNADEYCNEEDDNCNMFIDDNALDALVFYPDGDGDGFGTRFSAWDCVAPPNLREQFRLRRSR